MIRRMILLLSVLVLAASCVPCASAQAFPPQFRDVGIDQQIGALLPLGTPFIDDLGKPVTLRSYFGSKPVLLLPVYYTCTTLCGKALRGVVEGIGPLRLKPGRDFEIVAFSINPSETPADARKKLEDCTMNYVGTRGGSGWHFLTGSPASIAAVTRAIGFHYQYDAPQKMFVHASALLVVTPAGRISRYLFGVTYQPKDLQQGLVAASQDQIGAQVGPMRLLCYPYAASNGRYDTLTMSLIRWGAILMLAALALWLSLLWRTDLRRQRRNKHAGAAL